jgi:5-methylcytosine-specific restriction endonuclease McrA
MRSEFATKTKTTAWSRANGKCEGCGTTLVVGKYHFDHVVPDGLGGKPTLDNCAVLCLACHAEKTGKHDVPRIAKAKRQHARHIGAKVSANPLPGSKRSKWKRKMDGTVVRRDK